MVSEKTVERLSLYRRLVDHLLQEGKEHIFSHQLAEVFASSAAQVRRDLMVIGYNGKTRSGYNIKELLHCLNKFFDSDKKSELILIGVGNIGRALISYFNGSNSHIHVIAAFDKEDYKVNRVISNCRCYHIDEVNDFISKNKIKTAIVSVPAVSAQSVGENLEKAGIKSILNFSPSRLSLRKNTYVEDIDVTMTLEKVIYFGRKQKEKN